MDGKTTNNKINLGSILCSGNVIKKELRVPLQRDTPGFTGTRSRAPLAVRRSGDANKKCSNRSYFCPQDSINWKQMILFLGEKKSFKQIRVPVTSNGPGV